VLSKVHVWNAHFDPSNASADRQTQLLFQDERDRADRFHFARDRAHFIHSRAVVRALLGHYLDIPPEEVTFRYGRAGKPELLPCFMIRTCNSMCPIRAVTCLWLSRETVRSGSKLR
jgi:phosphopantetheinyl transferase